jgi:hypothetical protein
MPSAAGINQAARGAPSTANALNLTETNSL